MKVTIKSMVVELLQRNDKSYLFNEADFKHYSRKVGAGCPKLKALRIWDMFLWNERQPSDMHFRRVEK